MVTHVSISSSDCSLRTIRVMCSLEGFWMISVIWGIILIISCCTIEMLCFISAEVIRMDTKLFGPRWLNFWSAQRKLHFVHGNPYCKIPAPFVNFCLLLCMYYFIQVIHMYKNNNCWVHITYWPLSSDL